MNVLLAVEVAILWKAMLILFIIGILAAVVLYFIAKKFHVEEDPRIDEICALLPGANCGGCGYAGCRNLAETAVKRGTMEGCTCPGNTKENNAKIAQILGVDAGETVPKVAVVRCQGSCTNSPAKVSYDAAESCFFANSLFAGEGLCPNGCLGCGDCVHACNFHAIHIDPETKLPVVDETKCVGCGVCAKSCPRGVIEVRPKGLKDRRVYAACNNKEKGAVAMKNCKAACIGCGKCVKACPFEAITVENNLAYIDPAKCKMCRKCVAECPKNAIVAVNFPAPVAPKPAPAPKPEAPKAETDKPAAAEPKPEAPAAPEKTENTQPE